jgi:hypothetical protein
VSVHIGIEDAYAMSEDGDWYAFRADLTRGQVFGALAEHSSWWDVLRAHRLKRGYVREDVDDWYWTCDADHPDALPAWIVTRR